MILKLIKWDYLYLIALKWYVIRTNTTYLFLTLLRVKKCYNMMEYFQLLCYSIV